MPVVATDATQVPGFVQLAARAQANGVNDLRLLEAQQARQMALSARPSMVCLG